MNPIYICRRFPRTGPFEYSANFAEASSPIWFRMLTHDDFDWQCTPYQVANARHSPKEAERLIVRYVNSVAS